MVNFKGAKLNKNILLIIALISSVLAHFYLFRNEQKEVVLKEVEKKVLIEVPSEVIKYDTVYKDRTKTVVKIVARKPVLNDSAYSKIVSAEDKDKAIKSAVSRREYLDTVEDSLVRIEVKSFVTGTLDRQEINFKIKERIVPFSVKKNRPKIYLGTFIRTSDGLRNFSALGASATLNTGKRAYSVGYDTKKNVTFGVSIKL